MRGRPPPGPRGGRRRAVRRCRPVHRPRVRPDRAPAVRVLRVRLVGRVLAVGLLPVGLLPVGLLREVLLREVFLREVFLREGLLLVRFAAVLLCVRCGCLAAGGVPLRGVVDAAVEGLRAPVPLLGRVGRLLGLEPGVGVPLAGLGDPPCWGSPPSAAGRSSRRSRRGRRCRTRPAGRRTRRSARCPACRPATGRWSTRPARGPRPACSRKGVGGEGAGGVVAGAVVGGVVAVGGDVPVRGLLAAVRRVGRRGGIGSRGRGHGPRRVTVVHQLLFRLDNRGCQSSAATVPGGMRARQSSPGFTTAGNGHSVGFGGRRARSWLFVRRVFEIVRCGRRQVGRP